MNCKKRNRILFSLLLVGCSIWGYTTYTRLFSEAKVTPESWPVVRNSARYSANEVEEIQKITSQAFRFLGEGRQCVAFESADGRYVLKFIKCQNCPCLSKLFCSINVAASKLRKETSILFTNLEPKNGLEQGVMVIDRYGFSHQINLNKVPFIIQRKAEKALPTLRRLLQEGKIDELNQLLDQLILLLTERSKRGIIHPDGRLLDKNNVGFLEGRAVYIDLGTFRESQHSRQKKRLVKEFNQLTPIVELLQKHNPKLAASFSLRIDLAIQTASSTM